MRKKIKKPIRIALETLLKEKPETGLVENKYRTLGLVVSDHYPVIKTVMSPDSIKELIRDAVYLDRLLRDLTEGQEEELKEMLSQKWQLESDYHPMYDQDVKQLKKL